MSWRKAAKWKKYCVQNELARDDLFSKVPTRPTVLSTERRRLIYHKHDSRQSGACISFVPGKSSVVTSRIHIEFSSASPMAAILRRGPSNWVRLLAWNTLTDVVEPGAWFHGRIYEDGCSVSPDEKLFAYFATKYNGPKTRGVDYAWTAVSKLPWLTALALWPQSDTWSGRAKFADDKTLIIDCACWKSLKTGDRLPKGFTVHPRWIGRAAPSQCLPSTPRSIASFDGTEGIDQAGRRFNYVDGHLKRDGQEIVDLDGMLPDPQRAPDEARVW